LVEYKRSWISLIGFCLMTVFGAALVFALIMAGASVALASHQGSEEQADQAPSTATTPVRPADLDTFTGMITDSYCGARHVRYPNLPPTQCAAACIRHGASYVLVDGDHRYKLSGSVMALSKILGTRARVTGTLEDDTIVVNSAGPMF
jgi:hypothetical protein